jgi:hypothetical protein
MGLLAQLLIAGIQLGLDKEQSDFPAPIITMTGVFVLFWMAGCIITGVEDFYHKRLKRAVSYPGVTLSSAVACTDWNRRSC